MGSGDRTLPQGADRKALLGLLNCLGPPPQKPPSVPSAPQLQLEQPGSRPHSPQSGPTADQPTESSGPELSSRVPRPTGVRAPEASSEKLSPRETPTLPEYPNLPSPATAAATATAATPQSSQISKATSQSPLHTGKCSSVLGPPPGAERSRQF